MLVSCLLVSTCWLLVGHSAAEAPPQALWGRYGIEVNDTPGNTAQERPLIIGSGSGQIILWEDSRNGYYDLFAQKIDANGRALWARDGVAVCESPGNQNFPALIPDGAGGAIIVWQDYRGQHADIYAQRLDANGRALWGKQGTVVCGADGGQFAPRLADDGAGGAIIVWHDHRSGSGEDIYAQRLNADGQALWAADGVPVTLATGTQWYPQIAADGAGGAFIVWSDGRLGSANNDIYAQRLNANGKNVWEKDGIPVCAAPANQEKPVIITSRRSEGGRTVADGAIIVWQDSRFQNVDLYAQKIEASGNVRWAKDGVPVCTFPHPQVAPQLSGDGHGGVIVVWEDQREEKGDIYAQRIYQDGRIAWAENGRVICRAYGEQKNPMISKFQTDDWLIVWDDEQPGQKQFDLFAQKINSSGTPVWAPRGIPLASARGMQRSAALAPTAQGEIVIAWEDDRNGNFDVYAQRLTPDGKPAWPRETVVCAAQGAVAQQNVEVTQNGQGEILLVWEDGRDGFLNIYAQKVTKAGALTWGKHGLAVAKVAANQVNARVVPDGKGGAFVAWEDRRIPGTPKVRLQRLSGSGQRLWESSLPVAAAKGGQLNPLMIGDGAGGAIVIWQDRRDPLGLDDLYGQRVSAKGELLWSAAGKPVVTANGEQLEARLISDSAGGAFIAWTDFRRGDRNPDIYAQRLGPKGEPLWTADGALVCGAPDVQRLPRLIADNEGGIIVSWTDRGGGSYDIYAQRLNRQGKPVWLTDGIPINQLSRTQQNSAFGNRQVLVWEDYRYGNWDIFAQSVSPAGKLLWPSDGVPVVMLPQTQYNPQVVPWKGGSVLVAWEDYRSGRYYEIFLQRLDSAGKTRWSENGLKVQSRDGSRGPKLLTSPDNDSFYVFWEDYTEGGKAIYGQRYLLY